MRNINQEELIEIIKLHNLWLKGGNTGERANMSYANMHGANMSGANMSGADISHANIFNCAGNGNEIKTVQTERYVINITNSIIQIGCENHSIEKWMSFSDNEIESMDNNALKFSKKWKDFIFKFIELNNS